MKRHLLEIIKLIAALAGAIALLAIVWIVFVRISFPQSAGVDELRYAAGERIFQERCARCHTVLLQNQGISKPGPPLAMLGETAKTRKEGFNSAQYVLESIMAPNAFRVPDYETQMPENVGEDLSDGEMRLLVGFLLGRERVSDDLASLDPSQYRKQEKEVRRVDSAKAKLGGTLFTGKGGCVKCHSQNVVTDVTIAPGLFYGNLNQRDQIRKSILEPSETVAATYRNQKVLMNDGTVHVGLIRSKNEDAIELSVVEADGSVSTVTLSMADIEVDDDGARMILESEISFMPNGFDKLLTPEEVDAIVEYIYSVQ